MRICIIPARGGSKRIPNKNIKKFNGLPIISYSIKAALESKLFDAVVVSTDSEQIAQISSKYGADVPFIRPKEISCDFSTLFDVMNHAVNFYKSNQIKISDICCLLPTAPLITKNLLIKTFEKYSLKKTKFLLTVAKYRSPVMRSFNLDEKDQILMTKQENFSKRSQDLKDFYHDAGILYWGSESLFKNKKNYFQHSTAYLLPSFLVQDIDDHEDWVFAELMYKLIKENKKLYESFI